MKKLNRCFWVNLNNPQYIKYHDYEWGKPSFDDHYLFEMLILESFQAGLSWECVLNKREAFRLAFDNFDYNKIANYGDKKIASLMSNKGIIRNRLKILATINNAKVFLEIQQKYGSFSNFVWQFTDNKTIMRSDNVLKTTSTLSNMVSKTLKSLGMKFVGSTIIYSYLQTIGVINDHDLNCSFR